MKKNKVLIFGVILVLIVCAFFGYKIYTQKNIYTFVTDYKYQTMLNDGGSYISLYYEVNLNTKKIVKKSDSYVANEGYEYQGKVINTYDINDAQVDSIKKIFNEIIKNKDKEIDYSSTNYMYYVLKTSKYKDGIITNDYDLINEFESLIK